MARVLITGCSSGIGRATALELTERGHEVVASARRLGSIEDLPVASRIELDVTDEMSIREAATVGGEIDVLVNNAAFGVVGPVERVPVADIRLMFDTNYFGPIHLIQAIVPRMRHRGHGVIVNVSSVAGRAAAPLNGFYAGSKHALEALSDAMHYELTHFGIRTIVVEPGAIDTRFSANELAIGLESPPYDELHRQWQEAEDRLRDGAARPGAEAVATVIADAIENEDSPRRIAVGVDAELVTEAVRTMDDAEFETAMRERLGVDW